MKNSKREMGTRTVESVDDIKAAAVSPLTEIISLKINNFIDLSERFLS